MFALQQSNYSLYGPRLCTYVVSLESILTFYNKREGKKQKKNDWPYTSACNVTEVMKLLSSWPHGYGHVNDRLQYRPTVSRVPLTKMSIWIKLAWTGVTGLEVRTKL